MADINTKNKRQGVDNDGIRLAPTPIACNGTQVLPAIHQEFVLEPKLAIDKPSNEKVAEESTSCDFQPKKKDINKRWKRERRGKNFEVGGIMFIISATVILPYILGIFNQELSFLPFKYTLTQFNAIGNIIEVSKITASVGLKNEIVALLWLNLVPSLILTFGLLFILLNMIRSVFGMFGAIKPRRYIACSAIYITTVFAVLIASLVGASEIGVPKIDFVADVIYGFKTSELFSLLVFGLGNLLFSIFCALLTPIHSGYTR